VAQPAPGNRSSATADARPALGSPPHGAGALSRPVALGAAVAGGVLVGFQGRINGELTTRMGSALGAATASFLVGTAILLVLAIRAGPGFARLLQARREKRVRPWWWFSGFGGALLVSSSAHAVPRIGVALVSVCLVAGTTLGGLFTDLFGLGPSGRHPATRWRIIGTSVAIAAVAIGAVGDRHASIRPLLFILLIAGGAASAVQQGANGQLRVVAGDLIVASTVSFVGGSAVLVAVTAAAGDFGSMSWPSTAWLYLGGPLGVVYIQIGAATVRVLGVLRFALGVVAGQLISSVVIDATWPEPGTTLRAATVVGAVITVAGVWLSGRGVELAPGEGS
jgi:transporter family-2 protein